MFNEAIYKASSDETDISSNETDVSSHKANAPLYEALKKYKSQNLSHFHTPGHKATNSSPFYDVFGDALAFDVTELPQTDSLYDAESVIFQAESAAASHFGVKHTLFSAGGATLCIQAMMRLTQKRGNKLICARNVHRTAINAMALLGINPIWVYPTQFENSTLPGYISVQDIEEKLATNSDVSAVFITSPDYYGVISDIKGISNACNKYDVPLLVDNAHGSHLFYCEGGALHPIKLGASMTCDSAHKTLPVLTGGAFLQINSEKFSYRAAKDAMSLFGSTSPSYLIMLSLDIARAWLEQNGNTAYNELCNKVANLKQLCIKTGFKFPSQAVFDPARLTLDFNSIGYSGEQAEAMLFEFGITSEMHDNCYVVILPSPFNKKVDFERLENFIKSIKIKQPIKNERAIFSNQQSVMTIKEAVFAPNEIVSIDKSVSRIAAECRIPCPPGVPLIMPGELINNETTYNLKNYGVFNIKVVK
jgi:arginine decarboxylase